MSVVEARMIGRVLNVGGLEVQLRHWATGVPVYYKTNKNRDLALSGTSYEVSTTRLAKRLHFVDHGYRMLKYTAPWHERSIKGKPGDHKKGWFPDSGCYVCRAFCCCRLNGYCCLWWLAPLPASCATFRLSSTCRRYLSHMSPCAEPRTTSFTGMHMFLVSLSG